MNLSELHPADGSKQSNNFRRGRGHASGNGKTAGKGHKGQKARSGRPRIGFEGGQMPLYRRTPKRGFTNHFGTSYLPVNVEALNIFENGTTVTPCMMIEAGLVKGNADGIKVLGSGKLEKNLTVQANKFSNSALEKIANAGGKAEVI